MRPGLAPAARRQPRSALGAASSTSSAAAPADPIAVVLGIESSCDDTGVAIVTSQGAVLGEAIATQTDIHAAWGGVVPNLARDAHAAAIDATVDAALAAAGVHPSQLSAIAVTVGPGLGLCLRVGAAKARQLSRQYGVPLVSVHHMEAHALVARLPAGAAAAAQPAVRIAAMLPAGAAPGQGPVQGSVAPASAPVSTQPSPPPSSASPSPPSTAMAGSAAGSSSLEPATASAHALPAASPAAVLSQLEARASLPFPFLCLLVSGGHNLLVLVRGVGSYLQLGTTVDDALGEAYDKVARLLALDLRPHGGAALEALAREGDPAAYKFAVPMRRYPTCDFSFAGLKTSSRLAIERHLSPEATAGLSEQEIRKVKADIAASFQAVAVTHLTEKSRRGVAWAREAAPGVQHLVVAGGVACNAVVRGALQELAAREGLELVLPPPRWCTDNGVMVAWAGLERLARGWAEQPPPPPPPPPPAPEQQGQEARPQDAHAADGAPEGGQGPPAAPGGEAGEEWIELKPRWPLTGELHPRAAAAAEERRRSVKRVRLAVPLSELTPPAQAGAAAAGAGVAAAGAGAAASARISKLEAA